MVIHWRFLVAAFALAGLAACDVVHTPAVPSAVARYTVTATVMQRPGQLPMACAFENLPLPPTGCGGAQLRNLDLSSMPGVERYSNGVRAINKYLRLIGTWDGNALVLTAAPQPTSSGDATPLPNCTPSAQGDTSAAQQDVMTRIGRDLPVLQANGIELLEVGPCGQSMWVLLVVADAASVRYMTKHYGPLQVAGWLQPVGTRPAP